MQSLSSSKFKLSPSKITLCVALIFVVIILQFPTNNEIKRIINEKEWSINTCEEKKEYVEPQINDVDLEMNIDDVNLEDSESLQKFCEPYQYAILKFNQSQHHICVWPLGDDNIVSSNIASGGIWESANIDKMYKILYEKPPGIVIDAGANVGVFTIIAAGLGHTVFAFEPVIEHVDMIKRSLALNKFSSQVKLYRNGLGNNNGDSTISLQPHNRGGSSVDLTKRVNQPQKVDLIKMDELFHILIKKYPNLKILFWKADIEGWEERMLNGARLWWSHYRPKHALMELMANGIKTKQCNLELYLRGLLEHYDLTLYFTDGVKKGPPINEDTVTEFAVKFPEQSGYVYDMWLTIKVRNGN